MSEHFLTRYQMNPRRRGAVRLLGSPQRLHAAVLACYPPDALGAPHAGRVLWRVDAPSDHVRNLFIVGPARPSLEVLQEQSGWSQDRTWQTTAYGPFLNRLAEGQQWMFRLTANPTRSTATSRGQRGKVHAHVTAGQQQEWLTERAPRHGFTVVNQEGEPQVQVTRRDRDIFDKGAGTERRRVAVSRAQFDGILEVTDPELLRTALVAGVGRAKAYGCGLLTLAAMS